MKRNNFLFIITIIILSSMSLASKTQIEPAWQKIPSSVDGSGVMSLLIFPSENSSIILAGTEQAVYRSTDEGKTFRPVLQLPSSEKRINYLYMSGVIIFAATNSGLFVSQDHGLRWEKIFFSADPLARHCLSVVVDRETVYLGTENGLFYQKPGESSWQNRTDFLNADSTDQAVPSLEQDRQFIYVSTNHDFFRIDKDKGDIQKIFSLASREEETEIFIEETDSFSITNQIKQIKIFNDEAPELYLATTKGVFKSLDQGKAWTKFNSAGLPVEDITSLLVLPDQGIWVGTLKGIFRYKDGRWLPLYKGMETNRVNSLTMDEESRVYAATDQGIFFVDEKKAFLRSHSEEHSDEESNPKKILRFAQNDGKMLFHHEPSIHEVHEMAIRYAEVSPQKIAGWRSAARKRGLMPKLSTGINRSTTEMFHWDTGPNPDALAKGRDFLDWDVSLSWDFGDLIWNPDQTSIDSRSKLMVELREDVLDQITRLYFERRRVQMELVQGFESLTSAQSYNSENGGRDTDYHNVSLQKSVEKEMRVEELTALIDALTGGEFSRRIQEDQRGER
ncbi:MAG TPA: hypothetical protein VJA17_03395 [Candidatus Omnitrophota bacterium]|nr:hypothetical protein [Candidatus Omnitrophota bacterium]